MTQQPKLINRTYGITPENDWKLKQLSHLSKKKLGREGLSESAIIRQLIDNA